MRHFLQPFIYFSFFLAALLMTASVKGQTCNIAGDTVVCAGNSVSYTGTSGASHEWQVFGGGTIVGSNTSQTVTVLWPNEGSGQLSLVVEDQNGGMVCSGTQSVEVVEGPSPEITPSFISACKGKGEGQRPDGGSPCMVVCDSSHVTYTTPLNSGSNYTWNVQGSSNYTISNNEIEVFWTGSGQGQVSVTETDSNGCVGEAEICVEIAPNPDAAFSTSQPMSGGAYQACLDQEIIFYNNSGPGQGSPLHSFEWVFGDGNTQQVTASSNGQVTHSYASPGTYQVMMIAENECYCKDTAYATIEVSSDPGPDIYCISSACPGTPQTYQTSADCPNYDWSVTNGTIISGGDSSTVTVDWDGNGPNILTLDVNGCNGNMCDVPTSIQVPVIPSSVDIKGPEEVCLNDCPTYRIDCSIPMDSIQWNFPPGVNVIGDSVNTHEVQVCFFNQVSGNISVDYHHDLHGSTTPLSCGGAASIPVEVLPRMNIQGENEFCANQSFDFSISNGGSGQVAWSILDPNGNVVNSSITNGPAHNFTGTWVWGPGNFTVMAEDSSGVYCNESVTKNVAISLPPDAPDTISGETVVCPSQTYNYTAVPQSSSHAIEWAVTNGSPATAIGSSINVTWDQNGPYLVEASQTDVVTGCTSPPDTLNVNSILPLQATSITGADTLCANTEYNFSTPDPGDQFAWDVTPSIAGSIIAGQYSDQVTLQTNNYQGSAWLVIEREICGQSRKDSLHLTITTPPAPSITAPATACQSAQINMSASAPDASSFSWDFGDGNSGSGSAVSHAYNEPGNYSVVVTAQFSNCNDSVSTTHQISIVPKPNTTISTPDPTQFCQPPVATEMFVASPVTNNTYQWYQNNTPLTTGTSFTATSPGAYYVIATNNYGCQDTSNIINVNIINCDTCQPEAHQVDFTRNRQGCNTDSFTAVLSNASSPQWNFNDPHASSSTATGNTATHTFSEPGYYRVELCAKVPEVNSQDSCEVCVEKVDTVNYIPGFYDSLSCSDNSDSFNVQLVNNTKILSTAPTPTWSWSINGNPPFSTAKNPSTQLPPGSHNVTLTVEGVCVLTKQVVIPDVPNADFKAMDSVCVGSPISFVNNSTGSALSATWYFGDGAESLMDEPTRTYDAPGNYTVSLAIANQYGCKDSVSQQVTVMPNTLNDSIDASGPLTFCQGDSVQLSSTASEGYPAYDYLWSNIETTSSIFVNQTGNYYVEVTDQLGCRYRTDPLNVVVQNNPQPEIAGPETICYASQYDPFVVNYPAGSGYDLQWYLDGDPKDTTSSYHPGFLQTGTYELVLEVTSADSCFGVDTMKFEVVSRPNVSVSTIGSMCEGANNTLIASSSTPGIDDFYWQNGVNDDTLQTSVPDNYTVTVIDSNGCEASRTKTVSPLPDLCGLKTGCYEICDSVDRLTWHAPSGYQNYTWFHNGDTIAGQNSNVLDVPLDAGTYTVYVENFSGCGIMSEPIEIEVVNCNCEPEVDGQVECGPVNANGEQTYDVTFSINNPLGNGANVNIYTAAGTVSNMSTTTLSAGSNTVNATFTDVDPANSDACFNIVVSDAENHCETELCLELPGCQKSCETEVKLTKFECAGTDSAGNPQYYFCMDVNWTGNDGASMTVTTASGTVATNPTTINSGVQNVCFTYTDMPPTGNTVGFNIYIYDTVENYVCNTVVKTDYKDCKPCSFDVFSLCAHCQKDADGNLHYLIEATVNNPYNSADVDIVPVTPGNYGPVSPNPIGSGLQDISFNYSTFPADSIICFKILLSDNNSNQSCVQEVCVSMPDCRNVSADFRSKTEPSFTIAPNPARNHINILSNNGDNNGELMIKAFDGHGRQVGSYQFTNSSSSTINTRDWAAGAYMLHIYNGNESPVLEKVIIVR